MENSKETLELGGRSQQFGRTDSREAEILSDRKISQFIGIT